MSEESDVYEEEQITLEEELSMIEDMEWDEWEWDAWFTWKEMNEVDWERVYEDDVRSIEALEERYKQRWKDWC